MSVLDLRDLADLRAHYLAAGYAVQPKLVTPEECREIVATVERHRDKMIPVEIDSWNAKNRFFTVNGSSSRRSSPRCLACLASSAMW